MTRAALVAAVLWIATPVVGAGQPAPDAAPDRAALEALLAEFLAGASRNDAAVHDRFWADSLVYTRSTGRRVGKADLMTSLRAPRPAAAGTPIPTYSAEDVRIQQFGDTGVVAFVLVGTSDSGGRKERSEFLTTGTFVKRDGRWRAVAWQSTRVPLTEAAAKNQVAAVDAALHAALLAPDVMALEAILDTGFVWTHSHGGRLTGRELLGQLQSGRLCYLRLETSHVTVSVHGTTAVVRGNSRRQRSANPQAPGSSDPEPLTIFYTLTLVHDGLGWKAVAMHTSRP
jgi:ketosteroid isomerase-like protein